MAYAAAREERIRERPAGGRGPRAQGVEPGAPDGAAARKMRSASRHAARPPREWPPRHVTARRYVFLANTLRNLLGDESVGRVEHFLMWREQGLLPGARGGGQPQPWGDERSQAFVALLASQINPNPTQTQPYPRR